MELILYKKYVILIKGLFYLMLMISIIKVSF